VLQHPVSLAKVPQYINNLANVLKYIIEDFRKTTVYSESVETVITPGRIKYSLAGVTAISSFPKEKMRIRVILIKISFGNYEFFEKCFCAVI